MHKREKYISNKWYVDKYVNTIYSYCLLYTSDAADEL